MASLPVPAIAFTATLVFTSWPLFILFQRGNIEGVVLIIVCLGILAALYRRPWLAATLIGIAGAMKIFPLVFVGLLLSQRRYKQAACSFLVAGLVTIASLAVLGPNLREAQRHIDDGLRYFQQRWGANPDPEDLGNVHSLFTLVKLPVILSATHPAASSTPPPAASAEFMSPVRLTLLSRLNVYLACTALFGVAAYFLRIRRLPMLNQAFALAVCAVLLPPVSWDYTLPHLLLPCALLCLYAIDTWLEGRRPHGIRLCLICLSVIFALGTYFVWTVRLSGQVRSLALLLLLAALLYFPFPWEPLDAPHRRVPIQVL